MGRMRGDNGNGNLIMVMLARISVAANSIRHSVRYFTVTNILQIKLANYISISQVMLRHVNYVSQQLILWDHVKKFTAIEQMHLTQTFQFLDSTPKAQYVSPLTSQLQKFHLHSLHLHSTPHVFLAISYNSLSANSGSGKSVTASEFETLRQTR